MLLKQLATSLLITIYDNQFATNLLTTCNRLLTNKLSQAMRSILISACCNRLLQDVNRLVKLARFFAVYALPNIRYLISGSGTFLILDLFTSSSQISSICQPFPNLTTSCRLPVQFQPIGGTENGF